MNWDKTYKIACIILLIVILFLALNNTKRESTDLIIDDNYTNYLKQVNKLNQKMDSITMKREIVKIEDRIIDQKFYYERQRITTYDINQLDSIIRIYTGL